MKTIDSCSGIFLPVGRLRLLDRLRDYTDGGIVCEMQLSNHWVFDLHFPGDPIFPGSLMIEAAGQTIAVWAWETGLRGAPRLIKAAAEFNAPLRPDDHVVCFRATVRRRKNVCVGKVSVVSGDREVATVAATLAVLLPSAEPSTIRESADPTAICRVLPDELAGRTDR